MALLGRELIVVVASIRTGAEAGVKDGKSLDFHSTEIGHLYATKLESDVSSVELSASMVMTEASVENLVQYW